MSRFVSSQAVVGFPATAQWINARFSGTLKQDGCKRSSISILDAYKPAFDQAVGPKAAEQTRNNLNFKLF